MSEPDVALTNRFHSHRGFPTAEKWLLKQIFKAIGPVPLRLALQDGPEMTPPGVDPVATIRIRDRRTLAHLIVDPEIGFGEAYAEGRVEVEGDLVAALQGVYEAWPSGGADTSLYQRDRKSVV